MRVKGGTVTRARRKRIMKLAKGYRGSKHRLFKTAKDQVMKSYTYAFRDRKVNKRKFRELWIARINAAARMNDISYSKLMHGLKVANIDINRKMLADLAVNDADAFKALVRTLVPFGCFAASFVFLLREKQSVTNAVSNGSLRFSKIHFLAICLFYQIGRAHV